MSDQPAGTVSVTRHVHHSADQVFDAWLDPRKASTFLFTTADGVMIRAEADPRAGGRFVFVDRRPGDGDVEHVGEYLAIERPRRLVFRFAVPKYSPDYTTVTIEINDTGNGCDLTLTHEGVPSEHAERTRAGWTTILSNLHPN